MPFFDFEEDQGQQPSPEQTKQIINYLDEKLLEKFGHPYKLSSATDDSLVTSRKYAGVRSLYKYGCSACCSRERNKYHSVCDTCKDFMKDDASFRQEVADFTLGVEAKYDVENPTLPRKRSYSPDGVRDDKRNRR